MSAGTTPVLAAAVTLLVPAHAAGTAAPPALRAGPAHVFIAGAGAAAVRVASRSARLHLDVRLVPYALDLRGRPRLVAGAGRPAWLSAGPAHLVVGPSGARVTVAARPPRGAAPGDHVALLLLSARPQRAGALEVRMRLGIVISDRVPGRIVRRLELGRLAVRKQAGHRLLELTVRNAGNVTETLAPGRLSLTLARGAHPARLHVGRRSILPRSAAVFSFRCPTGATGRRIATVRIGDRRRTYRVRL